MTGRRLRISHHTGYRYSAPVVSSFNEARMTPLTTGGQLLLHHELSVHPRAVVHAFADYWGAWVEAFETHDSHTLLEVVATSTVETPGGHPDAPGASWADLRDPQVRDRWCEFLTVTGYVDDASGDPDRAALVEQLRALPRPADAVRAAVGSVRDRLTYTPGATTVSTTAHEAWASRGGVCQDFTHATLSLLRSVGIPARYVSGYLHVEEDAVGETVSGESHAWLEVWDGGWEGHDPTNDRVVGAAHVLVARGRDYADVPPLKGIYAGGHSEGLGVEVQITQLAR